MDADQLRAVQAPLKDRYRADPKAGLVTLRAKGALDSAAIACKVETGRALAVAGLHPATGGSGAELCSGDMLLEALVACAGVTMKAVATSLGIALRSGKVAAEGEAVERMKGVVASHLDRFAFREAPLKFDWSAGQGG